MIKLISSEKAGSILDKSFATSGSIPTYVKVMEECSELITALAKHYLAPSAKAFDNITEECADVLVMVTALRRILGEEKIDAIVKEKLLRLEDRLNSGVYV